MEKKTALEILGALTVLGIIVWVVKYFLDEG